MAKIRDTVIHKRFIKTKCVISDNNIGVVFCKDIFEIEQELKTREIRIIMAGSIRIIFRIIIDCSDENHAILDGNFTKAEKIVKSFTKEKNEN